MMQIALILLLSAAAPAIASDLLGGRETELDADGDGKVDVWRTFGEAGSLTEVKYDTTGKGKPDTSVKFTEKGSERLVDETGDGEPDRRVREEFAPGGANRIRVMRTTEERRSGKDWKVERTVEYLPEKRLLKITEGEKVRYDVADVFEDDTYWQRYEACFEAQGRNCDRELRARRTELTTNLARVISRGVGELRCETDSELFLGNGVVVDRATCGARPAGSCPGPESNSCPSSLPSDDTGAVVLWCDTCRASSSSSAGCYTCRGRDDVTTSVATNFSEGVSRLLACFNPSSRTPGPYKHRGLFNEIVSTMGDLLASGGTGVRLSCPSDDRSTNGEGPAGQANASEGTVAIFNSGVGSAPVLGHEFLHLTSRGGGGVDDHNHATHNHPRDDHAWDVESDGDQVRLGTANDGELPNRYFDRVYGCQFLCFENSEFISKEQCETCLGYPGGGRNVTRPCRNLMSRDDLARVNRRIGESRREVALACGRQYTAAREAYRDEIRRVDITADNDYVYVPDLAAAERDAERSGASYITYRLNLEPPSGSDAASAHFDGDSYDTRRTYSEIRASCGSAFSSMQTVLDDVLAGSAASDPRNRAELESLKREFQFREAGWKIKKVCSEIRLYGFARGNCIRRRGASTCQEFFDKGGRARYFYTDKLAPRLTTLNDQIAAWNTLAAVPESSLSPGFSSAVWTGDAITTVDVSGPGMAPLNAALAVCGQTSHRPPEAPAMSYPEAEIIEVSAR